MKAGHGFLLMLMATILGSAQTVYFGIHRLPASLAELIFDVATFLMSITGLLIIFEDESWFEKDQEEKN